MVSKNSWMSTEALNCKYRIINAGVDINANPKIDPKRKAYRLHPGGTFKSRQKYSAQMRIWRAIKWWIVYYVMYGLVLGLLFMEYDQVFNIAIGLAFIHTFIKLRKGGIPQTYRSYRVKNQTRANEREQVRAAKESKARDMRRRKERNILDAFKTEVDIAKISSRYRVTPREVQSIIENGVRNGVVRGGFTKGYNRFVSRGYIKTLLLEEV